MNWRPFAIAFALPIGFAAVTLAQVAWNRQQTAEEIVLTERDVSLDAGGDDSSGARFWLSWSDSQPATRPWLDRQALETLGFDCSVDPASPDAEQHYSRQLPRYAFVAFALDGTRLTRSRLVPIDADRDAAALRQRNSGRAALVTAAVLQVARFVPIGSPAYVAPVVVSVDPRSVQVPTSLRTAIPARARSAASTPIDIRVRYGRRWEPWVVGIRRGAER
jgi:hypothetical protein